MSTPTIQEILAAVPSLAAQIDSFNELIPGVPATEKNLATLFEAMKQKKDITLDVPPNIKVDYHVMNYDDDEDEFEGSHIRVKMGVRLAANVWFDSLEGEMFFNFDIEGFYKALLWTKEAVRSVIRDGICKCLVPYGFKRRKLANMPLCINCFLTEAVQCTAEP
jgi:hypothetical protein